LTNFTLNNKKSIKRRLPYNIGQHHKSSFLSTHAFVLHVKEQGIKKNILSVLCNPINIFGVVLGFELGASRLQGLQGLLGLLGLLGRHSTA
jgi:hypothetical protein